MVQSGLGRSMCGRVEDVGFKIIYKKIRNKTFFKKGVILGVFIYRIIIY